MACICIFTVITAVVLVSSFGCGQQGASNTPSGSTKEVTLPRESPEPTTTTGTTTIPGMLGALEYPTGMAVSGITDYVMGAKGRRATRSR